MRTITTAAAASVVLLVLAGCGGSDTSSGNPTTTSTTTVATSSSLSSSSADSPSSTPPAASSAEDGGLDETDAIKIPRGSSIAVGVKAEGTLQDLRVTSYRCGVGPIKGGGRTQDANGDWRDYRAAEGKQLCVVEGTTTNTGNMPVSQLSALKRVRGTDGNTYEQSIDDVVAAERVHPDGSGWVVPGDLLEGFNPGDTLKWVSVYQLPNGVEPTAVVVPDSAGQPGALMMLK